jgi:glycosyltransferase involved in cell wall biosynthesis
MAGISVIVPTYNRSNLLRQTLESVVAQTRQVDQIIVVDDGSTDDTRSVVSAFGNRVTYHFQKNQFLGAARNSGQRMAVGEFVMFLDSDDLLLPEAIARLEDSLTIDGRVVLAYGGAEGFNSSGPVDLEPIDSDETGNETSRLIRANFIRTIGCALIRRKCLERAGFWDTRLRGVEDWDMLIRLSLHGTFARTPEAVLRYRVHDSNMSGNAGMMRYSSYKCLLKHSEKNSSLRNREPQIWMNLRKGRPWLLGSMRREQWTKVSKGDVRALPEFISCCLARVMDDPLRVMTRVIPLRRRMRKPTNM